MAVGFSSQTLQPTGGCPTSETSRGPRDQLEARIAGNGATFRSSLLVALPSSSTSDSLQAAPILAMA